MKCFLFKYTRCCIWIKNVKNVFNSKKVSCLFKILKLNIRYSAKFITVVHLILQSKVCSLNGGLPIYLKGLIFPLETLTSSVREWDGALRKSETGHGQRPGLSINLTHISLRVSVPGILDKAMFTISKNNKEI